MGRPTGQELARLAFYILLFAALASMHLSMSRYAFDDAYIHFRIAGNLLESGKPYFNLGEPVMGSTSSGWTMMLYLVFLLSGASVKAVSLYNAAATTLNVYVYSAMAREVTGKREISADILTSLVVLPAIIYASIGLMETPTATLMLGTGALLFQRGAGLSFLFLAAGVFFRPELSVFLLLFAALNLRGKYLPVWRMVLFTVLGAAPFVIYNHFFFGTDIPHTIKAKSLVFVIQLADVINTGFPAWPLAGRIRHKLEFALVAVLAYMTLRTALRNRHGRASAVALLLSGGGTAVVAAYMARKVYVLEWYAPVYFVPLFMAALICVLDRRSRATAVLAALMALAMVPFALNFCRAAYASAADKSLYPGIHDIARAQKYIETGGRLYARYPGYSLMSSEIGGLGYAFKGKIYDAAGLVSEDALKYHPMKVPEERLSGFIATVPAGYAREKMPDIIVGYTHHLYSILLSDICENYIIITEDIYAPRDMYLTGGGAFMENIKLKVLIRKDRYTRGY